MKNIKQTIIGVFAIIGVLAILTGSTNTTPQPTYATPESHVWDITTINMFDGTEGGYLLNKKTGEVRKLENGLGNSNRYWVMVEKVPKQKKN